MTSPNPEKRKLQRELQLKLMQQGDLPSCISCEMFDNESETCKRFGNKRPPLEWLVVGCMEWEPAIPF